MTAWITGGGSGIGAALARRLAATGRRVVISGRRPDALAAVAAEAPGLILPRPLDIRDRGAVAATVAEIDESVGPVTLAVLNAGTYQPSPASAFDSAVIRDMMETNLMGTVHCLEALIPRLRARRSGHLALVSSVAGYRGLPRAAGYAASKAAVIALAESLKLDLDPDGVRVTLINPGFVDTPLTSGNPFPMPDIIPAEQAAAAILAGLARSGFEVAFPPRFALAMKLLRLLPDRLFFPLVHKVTGL